jgi:hypothetical protein
MLTRDHMCSKKLIRDTNVDDGTVTVTFQLPPSTLLEMPSCGLHCNLCYNYCRKTTMIHQCGMHTRNRTLLLMHTACSECYENTLNTRRASGIQDPPTGQVYCPTCGRNVPSAQTPTSMMLEPVKYARVMLGDDTRLTFIEAVDGDGSKDTGPDDDTTDNFGVAVVPDVGLAAAPDVDMAVVSQQHPPGNTSPTVEQLMAMMNQLNCRQQEAGSRCAEGPRSRAPAPRGRSTEGSRSGTPAARGRRAEGGRPPGISRRIGKEGRVARRGHPKHDATTATKGAADTTSTCTCTSTSTT